MIVCVCRSVSDRAVRAAREAGARTLEAVTAATGASADCGCCTGAIAKVLAEPCRIVPCAGCPNRSEGPGSVPRRIAAQGVETP